MNMSYPCGGMGRRRFLACGAALPLVGALTTTGAAADDPEKGQGGEKPGGKELGVPGPYPGRVIEARNPAMIRDGQKNREAIKATLARGMKELTGADDAVEAWRTFFEPGDVVGIKVVPNGFPLVHTSPELMLEVIEALKSAGVKTKDMIVFDRYKSEFMAAKMHEAVPHGILWGGLTSENDPSQLQLKFPGNDPVAGYDPDEFMQMNLVHYGHDPKDDRNFRSHLGLLITKRVNKL